MSRTINRASTGFTLVELLVVIAIIALLISLLLPALGKVQNQARQTVCMSNMRQIAMAEFLYATDNQGLLPPSIIDATGDGDTFKTSDNISHTFLNTLQNYMFARSWYCEYGTTRGVTYYNFKGGFLSKYLQNQKVLLCPGFYIEPPPVASAVDYVGCMYGNANYGGYNQRLYGILWNYPNFPKKIAEIRETANTVVYGDAIGFGPTVDFLTWPTQLFYPSQNSPGGVGQGNFHGRHPNGRGVLGFFDGHAAAVTAQLRPQSMMFYADKFAQFQSLHIGECLPPSTRMNPDPAAYAATAISTYDYYFWVDKNAKGI